MTEELFDLASEYEAMLMKGVRLSGEDWRFFVRGRLRALQEMLPASWTPKRVLDFGCGLGHTTRHLADHFPKAEVVGVDTSRNALEHAEQSYGEGRIQFRPLEELPHCGKFDLCYTNGVFHHIERKQRAGALEGIRKALGADGKFALFENNPWNPGTRLVMSRIPFDRNADTLAPPVARRLLEGSGCFEVEAFRSLFYFPHVLSLLRFTEPWMASLPLGAQYGFLASARPVAADQGPQTPELVALRDAVTGESSERRETSTHSPLRK